MAQKKVQTTPVNTKGRFALKYNAREIAKKAAPYLEKMAKLALKSDEFLVKSFLSEDGKKALKTEGNEKLLDQAFESAVKCLVREVKKNI